MSPFRRRLGWALVDSSLLLLLFTIVCFAWQPELFAAFTVMPIWLWGSGGIFLSFSAFYLLRARWSLLVTAAWAATLLIGADEACVLWHFGKSPPLPGLAAAPTGKRVIRVLTLNSASFIYGNPTEDIAKWQPDIVLLQEVFPWQARQVAEVIYSGKGDFRANQTNAILTRWKITREVPNPSPTDLQVTIALPDGTNVEVVNVHLASAATDLRLWRRSAWAEHRSNRRMRQQELAVTLQILRQTTLFPATPTILGGDFNAPASDVVHRQLAPHFLDAFHSAGTGWGDTFHRRFPILRIDRIHATPDHFAPLRCRVIPIRHSDHRIVVADLLVK
jgi:endonuclease/exonuclease/phosphatase (EEP) superfamily protein YafD